VAVLLPLRRFLQQTPQKVCCNFSNIEQIFLGAAALGAGSPPLRQKVSQGIPLASRTTCDRPLIYGERGFNSQFFMKRIEYELVEHSPELFTYFIMVDGYKAGWIHVKIIQNTAVINDIVVREEFSHRFSLLPFFKKRISFRKCGFGSCLLKKAIERCRDLEMVMVTGIMHGDQELLTRWYTKNGFQVVGNSICYKI